MRKIFAIGLTGVLFSSTLFGAWAWIELDELVRESDLMVIGTLHSATEDNDGIGRGRIKVEEIIAGKAMTFDGVSLKVGDNLRINWADNWACAAGMHQRRIGKLGVWLLEVEDNGTVSAAYPGKFTNIGELPEIRRLHRKGKPKGTAAVDIALEQTPNFEPEIQDVARVQHHVIDIAPNNDDSVTRAFLVLLIATGLYWTFYGSRFRIR
jgi:hypothetical protein